MRIVVAGTIGKVLLFVLTSPGNLLEAIGDVMPIATKRSKLAKRKEAAQVLVPGIIAVPITTFAPEPYELRRPPLVIVQHGDEGFTASFFDANIHASGDTEEEAFRNLKSLLLDVFDSLRAESPENLGPEPKRQLAVLEEFIGKKTRRAHPRRCAEDCEEASGRSEAGSQA